MSFDAYHKNKDHIYRCTGYQINHSNGERPGSTRIHHCLYPNAMRPGFPTDQKLMPLNPIGKAQLYVPGKDLSDEKRFKENDGLFWVEPPIFEIFDFKWLAGSYYRRLKDPNTDCIDRSIWQRNYRYA